MSRAVKDNPAKDGQALDVVTELRMHLNTTQEAIHAFRVTTRRSRRLVEESRKLLARTGGSQEGAVHPALTALPGTVLK